MSASETLPGASNLEAVVHSQSDVMYDVIALIAAAEDRIESHASPSAKDDAHHTLRLLQMARAKVNKAIDAFDPFI